MEISAAQLLGKLGRRGQPTTAHGAHNHNAKTLLRGIVDHFLVSAVKEVILQKHRFQSLTVVDDVL